MKRPQYWIYILIVLLIAAAINQANSQESGIASWYGSGFHGHRTASGERYNMNAATCAHRTLRFGTLLRVTHARTGRSTICRVSDRGPFVRGRVVDLSRSGARDIGLIGSGVAPVRIDVVGRGESNCLILPRGTRRWHTCREVGRGL